MNDAATPFVSVNGSLIPAEAAVNALDRGFLYGDGLFETLRACEGTPFLLEEHVARLNASGAALRLGAGVDLPVARREIQALLETNGLRHAYVRLTVTRGLHDGDLALGPPAAPTRCIIARRLPPPRPAGDPARLSAAIASVRRSAECPLARHKTLNYLANLLAKTEARGAGADEAILLDTRGLVAEAASSNVFLVARGTLVTPSLDTNILPGVTRRKVLDLASAAGIRCEERDVAPEEFQAADEMFLTNAIAGIASVCAVGGEAIGTGAPGPATCALHSAYTAALTAASGADADVP